MKRSRKEATMTRARMERIRKELHISVFQSRDEALLLRLVLSARRGWGHWLCYAFIWHHFATLTFAYDPTLETVLGNLKRWVRYLERRSRGPVGCFYVIERGTAGRLHAHVLLVGTLPLLTAELERGWQPGRADVSIYDRQRPGSFYLTKDIGLGAVDWGFVGASKLQRVDEANIDREDEGLTARAS
jgi:hypothetical protein